MDDAFGEDYFERGVGQGLSNYESYRWLPEHSRKQARTLIHHLGLAPGTLVLDFGCAKGFLVRALREYGIDAHGHDVSEYAVTNCDPAVRDVVSTTRPTRAFEWVVAMNTLEHVDAEDLVLDVVPYLRSVGGATFASVPLARDGVYVLEQNELDVTHKLRWSLERWRQALLTGGFRRVAAEYRVQGLYDQWADHWDGLGHITCHP